MEDNKQKVVTYVGSAIIILLLIGLVVTVGFNNKNKKSLNSEKLASEKLLSEKLLVEKDLEKLKNDFSLLDEKNSTNLKALEEANLKIAENQKRINSLGAENRSLRNAKKELAELQSVKENLEKESIQLKSEYEKLLGQSKDLQNTIASLEAEKKELTLQLEKIKTYSTDNFLVTATRGKKTEKVVICSSRTKKLNVAFDVPKSLTESISFKIVTPSGSVITPDDKSLSWTVNEDPRNFTASLSPASGEFEESRQVILTYTVQKKLAAGEYKIQILCDGTDIGNCRIKLK